MKSTKHVQKNILVILGYLIISILSICFCLFATFDFKNILLAIVCYSILFLILISFIFLSIFGVISRIKINNCGIIIRIGIKKINISWNSISHIVIKQYVRLKGGIIYKFTLYFSDTSYCVYNGIYFGEYLLKFCNDERLKRELNEVLEQLNSN